MRKSKPNDVASFKPRNRREFIRDGRLDTDDPDWQEETSKLYPQHSLAQGPRSVLCNGAFTVPNLYPGRHCLGVGSFLGRTECVQAVRAAAASVTIYPTTVREIRFLRAVHRGVRTGDLRDLTGFYKENGCGYAPIALRMTPTLHCWLADSEFGSPELDIMRVLDLLEKKPWNTEMVRAMDAQLEYDFRARMMQRTERERRRTVKPEYFDMLAGSEHNDPYRFELPFTVAYFTDEDYRRIVEDGEQDSLWRSESEEEIWLDARRAIMDAWGMNRFPAVNWRAQAGLSPGASLLQRNRP